MKKLAFTVLYICFGVAAMAQTDEATFTKVGDQVPSFKFELEKGKTTSIENYKGKLVLINLFATWCPPCNIELPRAQTEIWGKYKDNKDFAFFVFGREQGWDVLNPYKKEKGFTFPILPDADRAIFSKFAKQSIPRNILVDENGKIIYQSLGYSADEFNELVKLIDKHLADGSTK